MKFKQGDILKLYSSLVRVRQVKNKTYCISYFVENDETNDPIEFDWSHQLLERYARLLTPEEKMELL